MIKQNKKILIIRCGLLGDTVDATSVVDPLLEHYGNEVDIHWVTKPGISKLFSEDPRIIKTFEFALKYELCSFIFVIINLNAQSQPVILN